MVLGIVALAMFVGGSAAVASLISGHSVLFALMVYSGSGVVAALVVCAVILAKVVFSTRSPGLATTDSTA